MAKIVPTPVALLEAAIEALEFVAHDDAAHNGGDKEDKLTWHDAQAIKRRMESFGYRRDGATTYHEGALPPVALMTLLHLHSSPTPLHQSNATQASLEVLGRHGLIIAGVAPGEPYEVTAKGREHIKALGALPFPKESTNG